MAAWLRRWEGKGVAKGEGENGEDIACKEG